MINEEGPGRRAVHCALWSDEDRLHVVSPSHVGDQDLNVRHDLTEAQTGCRPQLYQFLRLTLKHLGATRVKF